MDNIYEKLRERLDQQGFGYPKNEGADQVILKKMFSEEDAEVFVNMADGYQTADDYAKAQEIPVEKAESMLYDMSKRGLIYREKIDGVYHYHQVPLMHGSYEFNILNLEEKELTPFFATLAGTEGMAEQIFNPKIPVFRTIPASSNLVEGEILPYDDIEKILDNAYALALTPCACRLNLIKRGLEHCDHPIDTCLTLDGFADYAVENGFGHYVTKEDVLKLIREGLNDGRVINIINSKRAEVVCSCCSCSCSIIQGRAIFGDALDTWSNYIIAKDTDACVNCGKCAEVCPVKAIGEDLTVDTSHCIGCGTCAYHCPTGALKLHKKEKTYEPADQAFDTYAQMREDLHDKKVALGWQSK